jgi:hypothetical protein
MEACAASARIGQSLTVSMGRLSTHLNTLVADTGREAALMVSTPVPQRRCETEGGMTWEWEHRSTGGQWVLTVGVWQAAVQRVAGSRLLWQATLARTITLNDLYLSHTFREAVDARTWRLRTIAELGGAVL